MRNSQRIRGVMGVCATLAYMGRIWLVGNGPIEIFGFVSNPFAFLLLILLVLAIPETIEMLPFGPTRK